MKPLQLVTFVDPYDELKQNHLYITALHKKTRKHCKQCVSTSREDALFYCYIFFAMIIQTSR